jgi:thiosulfate/3-mercaptopyruvate sulfurtransferase
VAAYKTLITVAQLRALVKEDDCRIVDCRFDLMQPQKGREVYLAGHIPGAVHADLDRHLAGPIIPQSGRHPLPDTGEFRDTIESWGIANDSQVVAYDAANGALAARLWWLLRWMGHERVAVLDGGLQAWLAAGGQLQRREPTFAQTSFTASPDFSRVATTKEIMSTIAAGRDLNLVDARDVARYRGESEAIDPVAGHIPGAINLPLTRNLHADGRWKPASDLAENWRQALALHPALPVTAMCGSGVTACHLILSAKMAGMAEPRLYAGSWSEWIRDPGRPVAKGDA